MRFTRSQGILLFFITLSISLNSRPYLEGEWIFMTCKYKVLSAYSFVIRPDGQELLIIPTRDDADQQILLPDGRNTLFTMHGSLYEMSIGSQVPRVILPTVTDQPFLSNFSDLDWFIIGDVISFQYANRFYIYFNNEASREMFATKRDGYSFYSFPSHRQFDPFRSFLWSERREIGSFSVSASDTVLVTKNRYNLSVYSVETGAKLRDVSADDSQGAIYEMSLSPDGTFMNYTQRIPEYGNIANNYLVDLASGAVTPVLPSAITGFIWSPDGQRIVYTEHRDDGGEPYAVMVSDADFSNPREVGRLFCRPKFVSWGFFG